MDIIHIISLLELLIIAILIISSKVSKKDIEKFRNFSSDIRKNYIQTLKNTVYNEKIPILERLIAFKEYIKLGGNGNCKSYSMVNLILPNKDLWQSVLDNDKLDNLTDKDSYQKIVDEINDRVYS